MKKLIFIAFVICFSFSAVLGQGSNIVKTDLSQAEIDRIIAKFTANEADFRSALTGYVFNRSAILHILGMGGQVAGTYRRDSFMALTEDGRRLEKIVYFPVATTPPGLVTPEDLEDLGGVNPFALEPKTIPLYNITYLGKERIDELDLHVFEVSPKAIPDPKKTNLRLFTGRIWVDDRDLMIVKSKGKAVPETKTNKFPIVETWRENIDGKYWFPSYASADDELNYDNGTSLRIRMKVKYTGYTPGYTDVKVIGEEEEEPAKPSPTPKPKKP